MKYAHLADCHIGSWRDPKLREVTTKAFCESIDRCIEENVDFILISGDLFNTSLPSLDLLRTVVQKLKQVSDAKIPVYGIAGSHDYSPSGKTMLDVLAMAGLYINVAKFEEHNDLLKLHFTQDPKTGAKITGIIGKKGGLEKDYYHYLDRDHLENEEGYKIFLFHTALTELRPDHLEEMPANPISLLPKNFDYYAGGHVHIVKHTNLEGYNNVVYPGPLFPNNFAECEKLEGGGFYLIEDGNVQFIPIIIHPITNIEVNSEYQTPEQLTKDLLRQVDRDLTNRVITIRLTGRLREGGVSDINFQEVFEKCYQNGAHFVMKNTNKLQSRIVDDKSIGTESIDIIEDAVISEHVGMLKEFEPEKEKKLALALLHSLSSEKNEGERVIDFEEKVIGDVDVVVKESIKN